MRWREHKQAGGFFLHFCISWSPAVPSVACDVLPATAEEVWLPVHAVISEVKQLSDVQFMCSWTEGVKDGGFWRLTRLSLSLLVGDAPLPGGQHVVEGVSANASLYGFNPLLFLLRCGG